MLGVWLIGAVCDVDVQRKLVVVVVTLNGVEIGVELVAQVTVSQRHLSLLFLGDQGAAADDLDAVAEARTSSA